MFWGLRGSPRRRPGRPAGIVKVDRSYVAGGSDGLSLVRLITSLTHNVGLCVVAEGVENVAQLAAPPATFSRGTSPDGRCGSNVDGGGLTRSTVAPARP